LDAISVFDVIGRWQLMPSITTLRRRAARKTLALVKVREDSRQFWEYGPFMLVDPCLNAVVARGLDLREVEAELASR
jgi:hypothetical protein